jgi:hypothetical protein
MTNLATITVFPTLELENGQSLPANSLETWLVAAVGQATGLPSRWAEQDGGRRARPTAEHKFLLPGLGTRNDRWRDEWSTGEGFGRRTSTTVVRSACSSLAPAGTPVWKSSAPWMNYSARLVVEQRRKTKLGRKNYGD